MTRIGRAAQSALLFGLFTTGLALTALAAEDALVRVGGNVQQANLASQVKPVYPPEAKQDRVQGTVQLDVIIDKQGHVEQVSVLAGPEPLIQAAVDAVKQWTYRPTLLNGEPVRVETTVDVNFTLAR
jgi:periplasmic protein TonB